jgi:Tfp pilus assembly protein PilF/TolB-like protein
MGRIAFTKPILTFCAVALITATPLLAQQPSATSRPIPTAALPRGLYLVFPFENAGASPRLDWLGEGLEELTIQYLSAAGEQVYSHSGRSGELERYGLPSAAKLSRATMLRIAQDLDADYVIFGSFASNGTSLTVESRVLRVDPATLLAPVRESASLDSLMDLHTRVVWRLLSTNDPGFRLNLKDFSKEQRPLRLDAFEHFIRGVLANEDEARLRELREAARLEPAWADPALALGETYASRSDCSSALPWFAKVPKTHSRYAESTFAAGVCRLQLNQPDKAEEVFTALQDTLHNHPNGSPGIANFVSGVELPEILNNLGIAKARQGRLPDAQADLRRATELDPDEDDYPFNLGLLALRLNDPAAAAGYFRAASEREPDNPEDRAMLIQALERAGKKIEADQERETVTEALGPNALPPSRLDLKGDSLLRLERIKTGLDIATLRLEVESPASVNANSASRTDAGDTANARIRLARQELAAGRLDTAESEFRAALATDSANAAAHHGLAEIDRRRGKLDDAVKELQASLASRDSAVVRTMLARIYLDQRKPDLARTEAERALKLAPNYTAAKQLLEHLQSSKPGGAQ